MTAKVRAARPVRGSKGYESIARAPLQNVTLSFKARGILACLQSLPKDWELDGVEGIARLSDDDGYTAVNNGVKELEAAGLFARLKRQGDGGQWVWLYVYSHDPAEIAAEVDEWERLYGTRRSPRSGPRRSSAEKMAGQETLDVAVSRKPEHGGEEPPDSPAVLRFSTHGSPTHGSPVCGEPPNKEIYSTGIPPTPPQSGGPPSSSSTDGNLPPRPRCDTHGIAGCRSCGLSVRSNERAERDRSARDLAADQARASACSMCRPAAEQVPGEATRWARVVPGTQIPVSPVVACDHVTAHAVVLAEIARAEAEAACVVPREVVRVEASPEAVARAKARVAAACRRAAERRTAAVPVRKGKSKGAEDEGRVPGFDLAVPVPS